MLNKFFNTSVEFCLNTIVAESQLKSGVEVNVEFFQ